MSAIASMPPTPGPAPAPRRRLLAHAAVVAIPLAAALAVSCSHKQDLSDWLVSADAVCKAAQENADRNPAPQSPLPGDALRLSAKRSRDEVDELRKLDEVDENTGRKSAVAEYLITLDRRNDALEHYADDLDKAPAQGPLPSRAPLEDVTSQAYTQAIALGLEQCAGGVDFAIATTTTTTMTVPVGAVTTTPGPTGVVGQPDGQDVTEDQPG